MLLWQEFHDSTSSVIYFKDAKYRLNMNTERWTLIVWVRADVLFEWSGDWERKNWSSVNSIHKTSQRKMSFQLPSFWWIEKSSQIHSSCLWAAHAELDGRLLYLHPAPGSIIGRAIWLWIIFLGIIWQLHNICFNPDLCSDNNLII